MTTGVLALWLLTLAAGGVCAGLVRIELRLEERIAVAAVAGIIGGSLLTLLLGLALGLNMITAVLGPVLLGAVAAAVGVAGRRADPPSTWRASWADAVARRWQRETWVMGAVAVIATVGFWRLFAHTLFSGPDGNILAGFETVWADWSLHSTLASSFSTAGNLPPHDPIFSGGLLRYPFLADFHAATLETAGASPAFALAAPCAVLCTATTLLVVSLGRRLGGNLGVGILAMLLCLVGGGLGWRTLWWDACDASGHSRADCTPSAALAHPGVALSVLDSVHSVVAAPPRDYGNLQNSDATQIGDSTSATAQNAIQWYTPLLAWWLPQRTFVYGFAVGTAVLLLVVAGLRAPPPARSPFIAAGLLAGTLTLVHIHTLIALSVVLAIVALGRWRREWLWLGGITAVLTLPRLIQVAASGSGVANAACPAASTHFPYFEVGWKSLARNPADACTVPGYSDLSLGGVASALAALLRLPFRADFWAFWLDNQGVVLLVALIVGGAAVLGLLPYMAATLRLRPGARAAGVVAAGAAAGRRVTGAVPADLRRFCLPFLAVFGLSNVIVFQTWDWDNTKLLAWWYLGGSLLTASWIVAWWRRGGWRATLASLALASLVLSSGLSLTRVLHLEAAGSGGPYVWASTVDVALAAAVEARTPPQSVFLLPEVPAYAATAPNQPIATLAGRTSLLGYGGWLYSYGVDQATRPEDRHTIYAGCAGATSGCPVAALLSGYHIGFVLVPADATGHGWFATTYPLVVHSDIGDVFDVRGAGAEAGVP